MYNRGECVKLVPSLINNNINNGIEIKVLKEVKYEGNNYSRDLHKLAFEEYKLIDKYQELGQCLYQIPEGNQISEKNWSRLYKK